MKKITISAAFMLLASVLMAQIQFRPTNDNINFSNPVTLKNDTLYVPAGSAKFIKLGDKVYKLVTSIEEVKAETAISALGWDSGTTKINGVQYYANQSMLLNQSIDTTESLRQYLLHPQFTDSLIIPRKTIHPKKHKTK